MVYAIQATKDGLKIEGSWQNPPKLCSNRSGATVFHQSQRLAGPVAQSVEHRTPCGGSTRPGWKVRGSQRDGHSMFMSLLAGVIAVGGRP